jgi:glucose/arabinose dehydrogenase
MAADGARRVLAVLVGVALVSGALGCTPEPAPSPSATVTVAEPTPSAEPTPTPTPTPTPEFPAGPELPAATGTPQDVLTGLTTPWSIAFLPEGSALITLRDPGQVLLLTSAGATPLTGPGADALSAGTLHTGEGGLLGVAVSPTVAGDHLVYFYRTTAQGNEVVRAALDPATGTLGDLQPVVTGIPFESYHNGGRIAFGPDGMLYVATGDAGQRGISQDPGSLGGKILRVTPDGGVAPGNPVAGSPMWSLGHRNVQGLGWDPSGRMIASEFGQNTWDELNVITPGANYGWPVVEGTGGGGGMTDPVTIWGTDDASPSGIAVTDAGVYLAALRGERLWWVPFAGDGFGQATPLLVGELGRLRDVVVGPEGALWILTNNTDGRGNPRAGDDRVLRLAP